MNWVLVLEGIRRVLKEKIFWIVFGFFFLFIIGLISTNVFLTIVLGTMIILIIVDPVKYNKLILGLLIVGIVMLVRNPMLLSFLKFS